jgi:hypothetical protein
MTMSVGGMQTDAARSLTMLSYHCLMHHDSTAVPAATATSVDQYCCCCCRCCLLLMLSTLILLMIPLASEALQQSIHLTTLHLAHLSVAAVQISLLPVAASNLCPRSSNCYQRTDLCRIMNIVSDNDALIGFNPRNPPSRHNTD